MTITMLLCNTIEAAEQAQSGCRGANLHHRIPRQAPDNLRDKTWNPLPDIDPTETQEWLDALESVLTHEGTERAHYLLERLVEKARRSGAYLPYSATTAYINTIPPGKEDAVTR